MITKKKKTRRALVVSGVYRRETLSLALHATTTPVYTQRGAKQRLGVMKSAYVRVLGVLAAREIQLRGSGPEPASAARRT